MSNKFEMNLQLVNNNVFIAVINHPHHYMRMNNQQGAMQFTPSGALAYNAMRGPAQPTGPGYMVTSAYPQGLPPPPRYQQTDTRAPMPSVAAASRNCNTPMPSPPMEPLKVEDIDKDQQ